MLLEHGRGDPGIRLRVGQRQHHPRERDPVRDAVVHAVDDRRAVAEPVHHVRVPQGPVSVERHRHQVPDEFLERGAVARGGKREVMEVVLERVVRIVLPPGSTEREAALDDSLAEARVAVDEPRLDDLPEALPVERLVEQLDRIDHHQVRRPIHVQPCRVGV